MSTERRWLARYAWLSSGAAIVIIAMKGFAYWMTSSVGLLCDALEWRVNLVAACVALVTLTIAARPADEDHPYRSREGGVLFQQGRRRADNRSPPSASRCGGRAAVAPVHSVARKNCAIASFISP